LGRLHDLLLELYRSLHSFTISGNNKKTVEKNDVFIGMKNEFPNSPGLIINTSYTNHPTFAGRFYQMDPQTFHRYIPADANLADYRFYLEDLSLDTCFTFLLIFLRYKQFPLEDLHEKWLQYVDSFEREETRSTGIPTRSLGCLHSALGHAYISYHKKDGEFVADDVKFSKGFRQCMRFIICVMLEDAIPSDLHEINCPEYQRAITFLRFEKQKYLQLLKHATIVQLELPVRDSDRKVLVDALITTEKVDFKGVLKHFARTDTIHSWTKNGFGLLAVYRPDSPAHLNQMVISVDPHLNVHLKDLWTRLEQMEQTIRSRKFLDQEFILPAWDDYMDNYTLLVSPKNPSTLLTWKQVVDTLWELYCPALNFKVRCYRPDDTFGELCTLDQCEPIIPNPTCNKSITIAKWDAQYNYSKVVFSPTLIRFLAACIIHRNRFPHIEDLPLETEFDFLQLTGGVAVVHEQGVFLLDDWNIELDEWVIQVMDFSKYVDEFHQLVERFEVSTRLIKTISEQIEGVYQDFSRGKQPSRKELDELSLQATKQKIEIRKAIFQTIATNPDPNLSSFREKIEKRWGIVSELEKLYTTVVETENILTSYTEARINSLIQVITLYGFPMVLLGGFFEFVLGEFPEVFPGGSFLGVHFGGLALYLILSLVGVWILDRGAKKKFPFRSKKKNTLYTNAKMEEKEDRSLPL
jgi:hypothetical protein